MTGHTSHPTANDRFKDGFSGWFSAGLISATLLHGAIFLFSPSFALDSVAAEPGAMDTFELPETPLPPEPEPIRRPAAPAAADVAVDMDVTIPPTTMDANPDILPPPPAAEDDSNRPGTFTPMTVRPVLRNGAEVARALERLYPAVLKGAGVGGTVVVWCYIDQDGSVRRTQVERSSGYEALDRAALEVAGRMEFSPAYNRDQR
ncbi:MAG TPA: energy transducer TonB, partial [Longimicrobiales bacterium]|nr:energy transducer TonB [Longimicrobiales bacterium]